MDYQGYVKKTINKESYEKYSRDISMYSMVFHFKNKNNFGKVLDYGGRIGERTRLLKDVEVWDIDKEALKLCLEIGVKVKTHNIYDAIYCSHVIEHVENPKQFLIEVHSLLKKDGRLILVFPAENQTFELKTIEKSDNGHLNMFNPFHIFTLLHEAGFNVKYHEHIYLPPMMVKVLGYKRLERYQSNKVFRLFMYYLFQLNLFIKNFIIFLKPVKEKDFALGGEWLIYANKS